VGELQAAYAAPSSEHWNVAGTAVEVNANGTLSALAVPPGTVVKLVSGAPLTGSASGSVQMPTSSTVITSACVVGSTWWYWKVTVCSPPPNLLTSTDCRE